MKAALNTNLIPLGLEFLSIEAAKKMFPLFFEGRESDAEGFLFVPKNFSSKELLRISEPSKYEIYLSKGSELSWVVQPIQEGAFELRAYLEEGASIKRASIVEQKGAIQLKTHYIVKKSARVLHIGWVEAVGKTQETIVATIEGEGAEVDLRGGWHLCERETIGVNVLVEHKSPYARSNQLFKGVVLESARSSFEGSIYVAKGAHKTESFQKNNNVVFDQAQAKTSPGIQVYHDDVKASHGATVAKPSKEDEFYLLSRGFDQQRAKELLIESFLGEIKGSLSTIVGELV
jgi:Fe-S cluster assembly protein SufD